MSIRSKLVVGFGGVAAIVLVAGVWAYMLNVQMHRTASVISEHGSGEAGAAIRLQQQLDAMHDVVYEILDASAAKDERTVLQAEARLSSAHEDVRRTLAFMTQLSEARASEEAEEEGGDTSAEDLELETIEELGREVEALSAPAARAVADPV